MPGLLPPNLPIYHLYPTAQQLLLLPIHPSRFYTVPSNNGYSPPLLVRTLLYTFVNPHAITNTEGKKKGKDANPAADAPRDMHRHACLPAHKGNDKKKGKAWPQSRELS